MEHQTEKREKSKINIWTTNGLEFSQTTDSEAQRRTNWKSVTKAKQKNYSWTYLFKVKQTNKKTIKDKDKKIEWSQRKTLIYGGTKIRITSDFSETIQARRVQWNILSVERKPHQTRILYSAKLKKAECRRIDAFELWCWRRLLRVPWTTMRSNQSILKEISPGCSLEGLMLKLKLQ